MYLNALPVSTLPAGKGLGAVRVPVPRLMIVKRGGRGMGGIVQSNFFGTMHPVNTVDTELANLEASWESRRGNNTGYADAAVQLDPSQCASMLQEMASSYCSQYPEACAGIDVGSVISGLCSRYASWYSATFPKGSGDAYNYDAKTYAAKFPGSTQTNVAPSWATNNIANDGQTLIVGDGPSVTGDQATDSMCSSGGEQGSLGLSVQALCLARKAQRAALAQLAIAQAAAAQAKASGDAKAAADAKATADAAAKTAADAKAKVDAAGGGSGSGSSFLSSSFDVLGYQVPVVGALAAAGVALWFMGSRK